MTGAIARAIAKHNPGGTSVSSSDARGPHPHAPRMTVETCAPEKIVQVPCSKHGVLARGPRVADTLLWLAIREW